MNAHQIQNRIVRAVAEHVGVPQDEVDVTQSFVSYGLDSIAAVTLTTDLEDWLGLEIPATVAWDYPTIQELAAYLEGEVHSSHSRGLSSEA